MKKRTRFHGAFCATVLAFGQPVAAQDAVLLPSGLEAKVQEVLFDGPVARFRFVADSLGQEGATYDVVRPDIEWLCAEMILPLLADKPVAEVVISVASQALPFGEMSAETVQFFDAFAVTDGACIREEF